MEGWLLSTVYSVSKDHDNSGWSSGSGEPAEPLPIVRTQMSDLELVRRARLVTVRPQDFSQRAKVQLLSKLNSLVSGTVDFQAHYDDLAEIYEGGVSIYGESSKSNDDAGSTG